MVNGRIEKSHFKAVSSFAKCLLFAVTLLVGIEVGNLYTAQLASNLPGRDTFNQYFGVLSPLVIKLYLYEHRHI